MNSTLSHFPIKKTRIGFHYFPDTLHYRETDLETWLPELEALGASWLVIQSSHRRAIPELFLNGLTNAGIEPIVQFNLSLDNPPEIEEIQPILNTYARQGVNGVVFFDRPNDRISWQASDWAQQDLVERFLDHYIPFANQALQYGLNPIFPALEPGGSYWDTAFLRSAIESLIRRKQNAILYKLVLSVYSWTGNHPLNWGAGGPQRWTESKPYFTPPDQEDQRGFRIYEWYGAITKALLHDTVPMILLGAGANSDPLKTPADEVQPDNTEINFNIARLLTFENDIQPSDSQDTLEPIADNVLSGNFWLLSSDASGPYSNHAWYQSDGTKKPVVEKIKSWVSSMRQPDEKYLEKTYSKDTVAFEEQAVQPVIEHTVPSSMPKNNLQKGLTALPIQHYLLIPTYEWGIADWHLNVINPFVKKHMPTVGFSLEEAKYAKHVTVVGNQQTFSEDQLEQLRQNGSYVERISGDGTSIASQLAER